MRPTSSPALLTCTELGHNTTVLSALPLLKHKCLNDHTFISLVMQVLYPSAWDPFSGLLGRRVTIKVSEQAPAPLLVGGTWRQTKSPLDSELLLFI